MTKLPGSTGQFTGLEYLYDASSTITTGGTAQLVLPKARSRSSLIIENISDTNMLFEFGGARASATLSGTTVASCSVTNAGFGYSVAPSVHFLGGAYINGNQTTPTYSVSGSADFPAPSAGAKAHCVMSGSAPNMTIGSIVIDNPGSGYAYPPYVWLKSHENDPFGCAVPSASSGILLLASGGSYTPNGTICTTDQIAVYCATTGKAFTCKYSI